jgi:asparagine synthase (glutamine-hydrolysing)
MCGIAGLWGFTGQDRMEAMLNAMVHRGPDEGAWLSPCPGLQLGMRRLEILDRSGGHQPLVRGPNVLVFNGEIYNHRVLRGELEQLGHVFHSDHSDSETLLVALMAWGPDALPRLDGMWAFAWWDGENLLLCRDRWGKKPLYFYHQGGQLAFASERRALEQGLDRACSLNRQALLPYFAFGYLPAPHTLAVGIQKMAAGTFLRFEPRSNRVWVHNYPRLPEGEPASSRRTCPPLHELAVEGRNLLSSAVERRCVADCELGVFLSGGLDSSTITALASRFLPGLQTFSISFADPQFDESTYAAEVAAAFATRHHSFRFGIVEAEAALDDLAKRLDEPLADPSLLSSHFLCKKAAGFVRVALAGDGADEWLGGYDPFRALAPATLYTHLVPPVLRPLIRRMVEKMPVSHGYMSLDFRLKRTLRGLEYPESHWAPQWMAPTDPALLPRLLGLSEPQDPFAQAAELWRSTPGDVAEKLRAYYLHFYLQDDILVKMDRASMLHSLEVREPFLDRDWLAWLSFLPRSSWFHRGRGKILLRAMMQGVLPQSILTRSKQGFGLPLGRWLAEGSLQLPLEALKGVIDTDLTARLAEEHRRGKADHRAFLYAALLLGRMLGQQCTLAK